jgi:hypothetical protein
MKTRLDEPIKNGAGYVRQLPHSAIVVHNPTFSILARLLISTRAAKLRILPLVTIVEDGCVQR